ncbi:T9SS type A sorting domain-containing protein, partial [candidate division WOR-3 bacterium]|nr:T9SS type A sorting domain-containing protein [candidate division WOR-3 bacterium]
AVEFMVTGQLFDDTPFSGCDTIRVIGHDVTAAVLSCTPNPFRNRTEITFSMGQSAKSITLKIYNVTGRLIKSFDPEGLRTEGQWDYPTIEPSNQIIWDRKDNLDRKVPSGVYLLKVQGEDISIIKKVVVLD